MQITCTRIQGTNDFNLAIVHVQAPQTTVLNTTVRVSATELKKVVAALQSLTPANHQEQPLLNSWFARIP